MEDNRDLAVLEIKNKSFKLLVGYFSDGKVNIIYNKTFPLSIPIQDADIRDIGSLTNDLKQIKNINDDERKLTVNVNEVVVVYPSFGMEVYPTTKHSNTVSDTISNIDIANVLGMIEKEPLRNANDMVFDVIPNYFGLSNGKCYLMPPLGMPSKKLSINGLIYTLPKSIVNNFRKAITDAGLSIVKEVIAPIAAAYYLEKNNYKFKNFALVDIGAKTTGISIINHKKVIASSYFSVGGDDLTKKISDEFSISMEKADKLKRRYGNDLRKTKYNPPLTTIYLEDGTELRSFYKDDLVNHINVFLKSWTDQLINALKTLLNEKEFGDLYERIPIVLTGDGSLLYGLKEYLFRFLPKTTIETYIPNTICANEPGYLNALGAIAFCSVYKGTLLENTKSTISEIKREEGSSTNRIIENENINLTK